MQLILPINWEKYQIKFSKSEKNWDLNEIVAIIWSEFHFIFSLFTKTMEMHCFNSIKVGVY